MFNTIQAEINTLKIGADEALMDCLNQLHEQLQRAVDAYWTREELKRLILGEDVLMLGAVECDTGLWQQIREIQMEIIDTFGGWYDEAWA